ncbi:MAG: pseudaminic acid biosynthesis-associated methylase [Gammaproteobacteria bacterium]
MHYKTEQEKFWAGQFGNEYTQRNQSEISVASNTALFSKIFSSTRSISSAIEFGANIGLNLKAIKHLAPKIELSAIEINKNAIDQLKNEIKTVNIYHTSILDFQPEREWDFAFTKGVLIHINPDNLQSVYELLYRSSKKYICIAEYYNPSPVEVSYRGHKEKLFKRDFAGEIMDKYSNLNLIDYGFVYHPQDDITWFLLEKE